LEQERVANTELRERLERLSTEYSFSEGRSKSEIAELKGRLEQEQLSARVLRAELTSEINVSWAMIELTIDLGVQVGSSEIPGGRVLDIGDFICSSKIVETD
jgi:hypothetical protein